MQKSVLKSKTFYLNLMMALAPLLPVIDNLVQNHLQTFAMVWGAVAILLRFITKDKVVLID